MFSRQVTFAKELSDASRSGATALGSVSPYDPDDSAFNVPMRIL